jgi:hypothetical protein
MPQPVEQPHQQGGEFTRIFGRSSQAGPRDLPIEAPAPMQSRPEVAERPMMPAPSPVEPPPPPMNRPPAGPSEFTRITSGLSSGSPAAPAGQGAPATQPPPMPSPQMPQMQAPQMPQIERPQIPQVQTPQIPQVQTPQIPQVQAPQPPQVTLPPAPAAAGRPSSNAVLIFFIAMVICAAVLFVLYFALKK